MDVSRPSVNMATATPCKQAPGRGEQLGTTPVGSQLHQHHHGHHGGVFAPGPLTPLVAQPACYESPASVIGFAGGVGGEYGTTPNANAKQRFGAVPGGRSVHDFEQRVAAALLQHNAALTRTLESEFGESAHALQAHYRSLMRERQAASDAALADAREELEVCTDRLVAAETSSKALKRGMGKLRERAVGQMRSRHSALVARRAFDALRENARLHRHQARWLSRVTSLLRGRTLRRAFNAWSRETKQAQLRMVNTFWQTQMEENATTLIAKYEAELTRLRETIQQQAQAHVASEQSKKELEVRLKQLFLRGVSAMNLEAVHIFNDEHRAPTGDHNTTNGQR